MHFKYLMVLGAAVLSTTSVCAQKTVKIDYQASQARLLEAAPNAYVKPVIAEVLVDDKNGRIRDVWELNAIDLQSRIIPNNDDATLLNLKSYALFKSSEKHNCDMILVPTFDVHITNEGATISIVGYPANFANWTTGTTADYDWILLERGEQKITPDKSSL